MKMLPNKRKANKKLFFDFSHFGHFLAKKQPKQTQNEKNWQNPNRLIKLSKTWYVNASQQKKSQQKNYFRFWPFLAFCGKKNQLKLSKNELAKSKLFDKIF